jgi:CheY-like chemotaxis protein
MSTSLGVRVEVVAAEGRVLGDEDQIMQTLLNLLGNAVKFSEPGSSVRLEATPDESVVHFRVSDDGRGIPADKIEAIFERFQQVDSSDTRQKGGTGLGLTISRGIVERHGGRIWAESELGLGTTVHFTLPAAPQLSDAVEPGPAKPGAPAILVCDDDAAIVEQFSVLLTAHGYRPIGVTDGARAVELAESERPQAVVLDLMMPHTTGAQVLAALRGSPTTRDIPVVVISGLGPEADESVADATEGWLIKPVSEQRLVQAVSIALAGRQSGASVLLVEDDAGLAEVISTMLVDAGLEVVHASSAAAAIDRGRELRPDVIVLDMQLPDGDGSDVVAEFRRQWRLAQTPLVVYSAADLDDARRGELQLGTTVFLTKGRIGPDELRDQVLGLVRAVTSGITGKN